VSALCIGLGRVWGAMAENGTADYATEDDLPALVRRAVRAAERAGFGWSCRPAQVRLLRLLAGGVEGGVIGETGTGCGVGLATIVARYLRD